MVNSGYYFDELAKLRLPPHLAKNPHLQEFYGTLEWSAKAIATAYLGWFGGRPEDLHPLALTEKAKYMSRLLV